MVDEHWQRPPGDLSLQPQQVHLWRIAIPVDIQTAVQMSGCLSSDEQDRASRFKFERDRRRFLVSRSSLRLILARYLACDPATIQFDYGPYGKPCVQAFHEVQFNLSHSGELALCAVVPHHRVGVDLEELRPLSHFQSLSQRCLSMLETKALQQRPAVEQPKTFLQYWTCKEAYLKAIGKGLSQSLQSVEVSLAPNPGLYQVPEPGNWQLHLVNPGAGYVAAVVAEAATQCLCFEGTQDVIPCP